MEKRFTEALEMKIANQEKWQEIKTRAAAARFEWSDSIVASPNIFCLI